MSPYFKNLAVIAAIVVMSSATIVRAETSYENMNANELRISMLQQADAVDSIQSQMENQGVQLSAESIETLHSYSSLLRANADDPTTGARLKKVIKKTGNGLKKAGVFVLKTMGYVGRVGTEVVIVPVLSIGQFAGGLVSGSDPGTVLDAAGGITSILTIGVVATPFVFANPAILIAGVGFGALSIPTAVLCNDQNMDKNTKFCDNIDKIDNILYEIPQDATYAAGADIHDFVGKIVKKIFHARKHAAAIAVQ